MLVRGRRRAFAVHLGCERERRTRQGDISLRALLEGGERWTDACFLPDPQTYLACIIEFVCTNTRAHLGFGSALHVAGPGPIYLVG